MEIYICLNDIQLTLVNNILIRVLACANLNVDSEDLSVVINSTQNSICILIFKFKSKLR